MRLLQIVSEVLTSLLEEALQSRLDVMCESQLIGLARRQQFASQHVHVHLGLVEAAYDEHD